MKSITISGARRTELNKQAVKKLRSNARIPCVLYGGKENVHFDTPEMEFKKLVFTPEVYLVNLDIDGSSFQAIMQDVQFHPVTDNILHADFREIIPDREVRIAIPVRLNGTAEGVREGGQLVHKIKKISISALPANLPDAIELDISALMIGDSIRVEDLKRDGVTFLDAPNNLVVGVRVARVVVEETPAVAEAAPAEGEAVAEGAEGAAAAAEGGKESARGGKEPAKGGKEPAKGGKESAKGGKESAEKK